MRPMVRKRLSERVCDYTYDFASTPRSVDGDEENPENMCLLEEIQNRWVLCVVVHAIHGTRCAKFVFEKFTSKVKSELESKLSNVSIQYSKNLHTILLEVSNEWDQECCFGSAKVGNYFTKQNRAAYFKKLNYQEYLNDNFNSGATLGGVLVDLFDGRAFSFTLGDVRCWSHCSRSNVSMFVPHHSLLSGGSPPGASPPIDTPSLHLTNAFGCNCELHAGTLSREPSVVDYRLKTGKTFFIVGTETFWSSIFQREQEGVILHRNLCDCANYSRASECLAVVPDTQAATMVKLTFLRNK